MRFYLDEHFSNAIAEACRRHGADVRTTHELGLHGASDEAQLIIAAQEGRCLVTADYADFEHWTSQFQAQGLAHAGVLMVSASLRRAGVRHIAAAITHYDREHPNGIPPYMIDWLRPAPRDG